VAKKKKLLLPLKRPLLLLPLRKLLRLPLLLPLPLRLLLTLLRLPLPLLTLLRLPLPLLTLLLRLPLLPSNSWLRNENRPSGRFFYACKKRSSRARASASRGRGWV
jgi:hypothetical protein